MKYCLTLSIACLLLLVSGVQAQTVPTSVGSIELNVSTYNPTPGQTVTVTAQSYNSDLNSSKITWYINGTKAQQGMGVTSLTVTAPSLGKHLNISVSALTPSGTVLNESTTISSGAIDLVLESSGYVPPLFMGKMGPTYQNNITIVAIPHVANSSGTEYNPKNLVYQWKKNGSVLQDQSGYGKQTLTLAGDLLPRPYTIDVTASTPDNSAQAEGLITVSPASPSISFYVDDALYGPLFNKALTSSTRIGSQKEIGVLAVPYGFDKPTDGLGNLSFDWSINNTEHPELNTGDSVTLRAPEGETGSSNIGLTISNAVQILQGAQNAFSVTFVPGTSQTTSEAASF